MSWKPDVVLYHGGCNDGFGAAWACWKKWGSSVDGSGDYAARIEYVGMRYGDKLPDIKGLNVLFVDFSLKRDAMIEAAKEAKSIVVLDHHKTAAEELATFPNIGQLEAQNVDHLLGHYQTNVLVQFDMDKSGARLAWEFCEPDQPVPPLGLQYIEDRDLFRFKLKHTNAFTKGLSGYPQQFELWDELLFSEARMIDEGEAILRYHNKMVEDACKNHYLVTISGHIVPCVNVPYFLGSDCAAWLRKKYPEMPFSAYWFKRGEIVQWGLRSDEDGLDVSMIAQRFGGGGHRNAAGFAVPSI